MSETTAGNAPLSERSPANPRRVLVALALAVLLVAAGIGALSRSISRDRPLEPDGSIQHSTPAVDDAYIIYRSARNWANGQGPSFNPGERVEAQSSLFFTAVIAAIVRLGGDAVVGARVVNLSALLLVLALYAAVSSRSARGWLGFLVALFLGAYVAFSPSSTFAVTSGFETPFSAAWLFAAFAASGERQPRWLGPALLFGFAASRPEGALVGGVVAVLEFAATVRQADRRWERAGEMTRTWIAAFFLPLVLFHTTRFLWFGEWLPNTIVAKRGFPLLTVLGQSSAYIFGFLRLHGGLLLLAAGSAVWIWRERRVRAGLGVIVGLLLFGAMAGGGDPYPNWRYLFGAVPIAAALGARFIAGLLAVPEREPAAGGIGSRGLRIALALAVALPGVIATCARFGPGWEKAAWRTPPPGVVAAFFRPSGWPDGTAPDGYVAGLYKFAEHARRQSTSEELLAADEIGIIGYQSGLRVLDIFGLADWHIARLEGYPGYRFDAEYFFGRSPRWISVRIDEGCICGGIPADALMLGETRFIEGYDLVMGVLAGPTRSVLFERRREPARSVVYDFAREWSQNRTWIVEGGQAVRDSVRARAVTGPPVVANLMTPEERATVVEGVRRAMSGDTDPIVRAETMRAWLRSWRPFISEYPLPRTSDAGSPRPELRYTVSIPASARLDFAIGTPSDTWRPELGDGMGFEIRIRHGAEPEALVFSETIDPKNVPAHRGWLTRSVDLGRWAGQSVEVSFSTTPGPSGNAGNDFAGWGRPLLIVDSPSAPGSAASRRER